MSESTTTTHLPTIDITREQYPDLFRDRYEETATSATVYPTVQHPDGHVVTVPHGREGLGWEFEWFPGSFYGPHAEPLHGQRVWVIQESALMDHGVLLPHFTATRETHPVLLEGWDRLTEMEVYPTLVDVRDGMVLATVDPAMGEPFGDYLLTAAGLPETARALTGQHYIWISRDTWGRFKAAEPTVPEPTVPEAAEPTESEVDRLQRERDHAMAEAGRWERRLETLKAEVGVAAMEAAREHGWCSVVTDLLDELGIPVPSTRKRIEVRVTYTIYADSVNQHDPSLSFIHSSLSENGIDLDDDWEDVEVSDTHIEVMDVMDV